MSSRSRAQRGEVAGQPALARDADRALDRDPAHEPRVGEVLRPPRISQMPSSAWSQFVADPVDDLARGRSRRRGRSACRTCCRGRPSRSARRRCRAGAARRRRCRCAPARSRGSPRGGRARSSSSSERPSMPYMIWSGPVTRPSALAEAVGQPAHERSGLLGEAEPQQRVERERGVADPRVAVVPVALAAELLRQARRRRRDDRAGRR